MTETTLDSAEVLAGQLTDILVDVPVTTLRRLSESEFFDVFDWIDSVQNLAARMNRCPEAPASIKRWLRPQQLAGDWSAFTTWRPTEKKKEQRGLF